MDFAIRGTVAQSWIVQQDSTYIDRLTGTPQGGVISPLLANLFPHVGFDKWMEINHPEKPFERYADDVVVHCKTEKQAIFMLKQIGVRLQKCKLTLHPVKTKIVMSGEGQKRNIQRVMIFWASPFALTGSK